MEPAIKTRHSKMQISIEKQEWHTLAIQVVRINLKSDFWRHKVVRGKIKHFWDESFLNSPKHTCKFFPGCLNTFNLAILNPWTFKLGVIFNYFWTNLTNLLNKWNFKEEINCQAHRSKTSLHDFSKFKWINFEILWPLPTAT